MRKAFLTGLFFLFAAGAAWGEKSVAVYMAGNEPAGATGAHKVMGGELEKALSQSGKYVAVNRTEEILVEIAREHIYARSGAVDEADIMALGKQFGVHYLCIVEISDIKGGSFYLAARLVDVVTAKNIKTATAVSDLYDSREMMAVAQQIARELTGAKGEGGKQAVASSPRSESDYRPVYAAPKPKKKWVSAGIGGSYVGDYGGGLEWSPSGQIVAMPDNSMGAYVFFDAFYTEMFIGYSGTVSPTDSAAAAAGDQTKGTRWQSAAASNDNLPGMSRSCLNFGIFAKFPFAVDPSGYNRVYPMVGVEYASAVSAKLKYSSGSGYVFDGRNGRPAAKDMSAQWVKFGGGMDFGNDQVFWRVELLYGFRAPNFFELNEVEREQNNGKNAAVNPGHGLTLKIGWGM